MGFFGKLFGNNEEPQPAAPTGHQEHWATYMTTVNSTDIGSVLVDLGFKDIAPIKEKRRLFRVTLFINEPRSDGLPKNEEFEILNEIEDKFVGALISKEGAAYTGRITHAGARFNYFYVTDSSGCGETLASAMSSYPDYKYEAKEEEDPEWSAYFETLFPEPIQMQSIGNMEVLQNLQDNGDDLTKERQVDHWIYFANQADREKFLEKILGKGFEISEKEYDPAWGEKPYKLLISRVDKVDFGSIDLYTLDLWQIADDCGGEYDGWETSVVKKK